MGRRVVPLAICLTLAACNPTSVGSTFDGSLASDVAALAETATTDASTDDAGLSVDVSVADVFVVDAPVIDVPLADVPALDAPPAVDVVVATDVPAADVPPADVLRPSDVAAADGSTSCRSSRECSALSLVCDPVRMLCVECLSDVDCPTTQLCNADAVCRPPRCTAGPSECASETSVRMCDPRTGVVVMGCPAGSTCAAGRCSARVCTPNAVECASATERRVCNTDGSAWITTACPSAPRAAGRCVSATCTTTCDVGFADCNGVASDGCEADTATDLANCGACRTACTPGLACNAGVCGCPSTIPTVCAGMCVNTQNNAAHCGACGVACPTGSTCSGGACTSVGCGSLTNCGGSCVDTRTSLAHCGGCGLSCATSGSSTASIACLSSACTMTCNGINYDVDGATTNGCEAVDEDISGHTQSTARSRGSQGCSDTTTGTASGRIVSDARTHSPVPEGFSTSSGSAPDWFYVRATSGALCANNYGVTVVTAGGSATGNCYQVTIITDRTTASMSVSGSGSNTMSSGAFSLYTENSLVYLRVEKVCSTATRENVTYSLSFHL